MMKNEGKHGWVPPAFSGTQRVEFEQISVNTSTCFTPQWLATVCPFSFYCYSDNPLFRLCERTYLRRNLFHVLFLVL